MGFLCKIKEDKYLDNPLNRDLGLSNIYNVNTGTNFCFEPFNGPSYNMSGATKPITGNTSPCSGTPTNCYAVYNLSEVDEVSLNFNFTGSTDYTGYTGQFCYRLYNRFDFTVNTPTKTLNTTNPKYINCIDFSAITSSTLSQTISLGQIPNTNMDYMLRSYYRFTPKECGDNTIDTWITSPQLNNFNLDYDWYFISVNNPPTPVIRTVINDSLDGVRMVQETVISRAFGNSFNLGQQPIDNKINLYVNGIRLTDSFDYYLDTSQYPSTTPIVNITAGNVETEDIITVVYLVGPQSTLTALGQSRNDFFEIDSFMVTGFTTDITASTVNIVNDNTVKSTQEVFLTNDFDTDANIIMSVNGVTLVEDIEYYKSKTTPNKIILNPNFTTIKVGDILSFWYFKIRLEDRNDLGTLDENNVTIRWSVDRLPQQIYNTGQFLLEVTETSDTTWSSLFYSNTIDYNTNNGVYEDLVQNLGVNKDYKFRVTFIKTYKNILNEDIITSSDVIGYFNTKNDKIIYSY
jgi:hypothetical protein